MSLPAQSPAQHLCNATLERDQEWPHPAIVPEELWDVVVHAHANQAVFELALPLGSQHVAVLCNRAAALYASLILSPSLGLLRPHHLVLLSLVAGLQCCQLPLQHPASTRHLPAGDHLPIWQLCLQSLAFHQPSSIWTRHLFHMKQKFDALDDLETQQQC